MPCSERVGTADTTWCVHHQSAPNEKSACLPRQANGTVSQRCSAFEAVWLTSDGVFACGTLLMVAKQLNSRRRWKRRLAPAHSSDVERAKVDVLREEEGEGQHGRQRFEYIAFAVPSPASHPLPRSPLARFCILSGTP